MLPMVERKDEERQDLVARFDRLRFLVQITVQTAGGTIVVTPGEG